jgi:hypothetical protein
MLETIREYAGERLERKGEGDDDEESADRAHRSPRSNDRRNHRRAIPPELVNRLEAERDNMRAALALPRGGRGVGARMRRCDCLRHPVSSSRPPSPRGAHWLAAVHRRGLDDRGSPSDFRALRLSASLARDSTRSRRPLSHDAQEAPRAGSSGGPTRGHCGVTARPGRCRRHCRKLRSGRAFWSGRP